MTLRSHPSRFRETFTDEIGRPLVGHCFSQHGASDISSAKTPSGVLSYRPSKRVGLACEPQEVEKQARYPKFGFLYSIFAIQPQARHVHHVLNCHVTVSRP